MTEPSRLPFGPGQQASPGSHCGRDSNNWRLLRICSTGTCKAVRFQAAWTRSSACRTWRVAAFPLSCTPIKAANPPQPTSWSGCIENGFGSAGQAESAVTTTSLSNACGGRSSMRTCPMHSILRPQLPHPDQSPRSRSPHWYDISQPESQPLSLPWARPATSFLIC